ncbi:hypothetical protein Nepgr_009843 [Nepenthes gracilis]|uniref:Uncharacterized protein n=1 Tax=Nepenthes gracilis TaxID=150966 RepID=A0AAD3SB95_NEPGR|nr:hypothetical protein Nepgr_009843 [Nepenthes gracilis]
MDSRQSRLIGDKYRIRPSHQALMQDYLVLQKEFVSRKRKLQEAKKMKEILLDEIRFLRRRHELFMKNQSLHIKREQELVKAQRQGTKENKNQSLDIKREQELAKAQSQHAKCKAQERERDRGITVAASGNQNSRMGSVWNSGYEEKNKDKQEVVGTKPLRIRKKNKDLFSRLSGMAKRKISWQDQLVLEV